ncbi:MAG: DUF488 domain-containing protein [Phycisphaerales bacterium]
MKTQIKRVYDEPSEQDGTRVLVDRLWPRGLAKDDAALDIWAKDLAPSTELRKWFDHEPDRFKQFAERYRRELSENGSAVDAFLGQIDRRKRLTLLYAAKDPDINHAVVLKDFLDKAR